MITKVQNSVVFHAHLLKPHVQASQADVTRVDARESVSSYKRSLRRCMRNKILRSVKDKYHHILLLHDQSNKERRFTSDVILSVSMCNQGPKLSL